jgi:hypothetical protein
VAEHPDRVFQDGKGFEDVRGYLPYPLDEIAPIV